MEKLPEMQRAIVYRAYGGREVLEYVTNAEIPEPKAGEILVKNKYAGVNFIDTYFRSGLYPVEKHPFIPGEEGSGEVVKVGPNVANFVSGMRVVFIASHAFAEYVIVPANRALQLPFGVDHAVAAAAILQGMTAITLVLEACPIKVNDFALVHAAAGGTGLMLVQMLKILGAKVIGTASTQEKCSLALAHGAAYVINSSTDDVLKRVLEITHSRGVDAVFDGVGKATFEQSLEALRLQGTMVSFGNASGVVPPISIMSLSKKNIRLVRPALYTYFLEEGAFLRHASVLFTWMASGIVKASYKEYALEDTVKAQEALESRKSTGKLVLKI